MAAPLSPTRLFQCDGCGATLPVDESRIGKKCRCGRCGKILVVPGYEAEYDLAASGKAEPPREIVPETVSFYCLKCDTRLVAYTRDVGKKAKCPECGAKAVVPQPPETKSKRPPRAMHGEQYQLWGVDEAPFPAELVARQPKFYPVYCRVCDTLMQAHAGQVGTELTCPDCGAKTKVPPPPVVAEQPSVLVPEGEEYQIDEASPPPPRPAPTKAPATKSVPRPSLREQLEKEYDRDKPKLPRVPLLTGVFRMLLRAPVPVWWASLSSAGALMILLAAATASTLMAGYGAIMGLFLLAAVCVLGLTTYTATAAICCSVLQDSADGNDKLYNAPTTDFMEWFGSAFYLILALSVSAIPGWGIGKALGLGPESTLIGVFFCFPFFLLSMLESGSPAIVVSPRLLVTLVRRPLHWILFYLVSAAVVAASSMGELQLLGSPATAWLSPFVSCAALLVYFRLMGRLGWWLSESMPAPEEQPDHEK